MILVRAVVVTVGEGVICVLYLEQYYPCTTYLHHAEYLYIYSQVKYAGAFIAISVALFISKVIAGVTSTWYFSNSAFGLCTH